MHDIQRLGYRPQGAYPLDIEVFAMADLRQRGSKEKVRTTHRYDFHMLVYVMRGVCTQVVDFKPISCSTGSLLILRAGQAHNFGPDENWDGWIVLFRPEFILPASASARDLKLAVDLGRLPEHFALDGSERMTLTRTLEQMRDDSQCDASLDDVHALLRHQLHTLLTRLAILQGRRLLHEPTISPKLLRFKRFQQLVEERFADWHQVAAYAAQLGYSEKSLSRAIAASMGTTAKAFIAARIVLEAKRLLVHTDLTVSAIAGKLGFDEATNFSKFFKREAYCTPAEFRRHQLTAAVNPP